MASLAVGITNFGASVISLYIVNSFGRRPLMFIGSVGQLIGLVRRAAPSGPSAQRCACCVAAHAASVLLHFRRLTARYFARLVVPGRRRAHRLLSRSDPPHLTQPTLLAQR